MIIVMKMAKKTEFVFDDYMSKEKIRFKIERSSNSGDYFVTEYGWRVAGPFWYQDEAQEWIERR